MTDFPHLDATLELAGLVADLLHRQGADAVVIGAVALAVHRYPRDTLDVDLATAVEPRILETIALEIRSRGFGAEVHLPDPDDPLGGVVDVHSPDSVLVQIVNFLNPPAGGFPRLVTDASQNAIALTPGSALRVADLITLIAFKLYAGGPKSQLDILELLDRNPELDIDRLRARCAGYRLDFELDRVLALRASG